MKKSGTAGLGVGGSSIMMIFVLLCLTTFATLSVASANADLRLTEKARSATDAYYLADEAAERRLAGIIRSLEEVPYGVSYLREAMRHINDNAAHNAEAVLADNALIVSYTIPVNDFQELWVVLRISEPAAGAPSWTRQEWSVRNIDDFEMGGEKLNLWDGGVSATGAGQP